MKNQIRGWVVLAALFVMYSVIAFALPFAHTGVFWLSYFFAAVAIAIQIYTMRVAFCKEKSVRSKFYGFPVANVSAIYLLAQIVLSLVFMALVTIVPVWLPLVMYVLLLGAAVVGFVAADSMRDEVERQDMQLKKDVSAMRRLQSQSAALVANCPEGELRQLAQNLSEAFRYSDPVTGDATEDAEHELSICMDELERAVSEQDPASVKTLLNRTAALLVERNRLCKLNKK